MLLATLVAIGVASGAHPALLLIALLAFVEPGWFLVAVVVWSVYGRWKAKVTTGPRSEAVFLEGMAAELRGGASLRSAIADAAERTDLDLTPVVRMARAGRPMGDIAVRLAEHLPINGMVAGPALNLAASAGSSVAGVFDALALRSAEIAEEERERKSLTAQARLSAWLVGGAPAAVACAMFLFGGSVIGRGPAAATIAVVGFGLQLAGAAVVWRMVRAQPW
jgi:Flp pilus assembly protein TadB